MFKFVCIKVPGAAYCGTPLRCQIRLQRNARRWVTVAFGGGDLCSQNPWCLCMWPAAAAGGPQTATKRRYSKIGELTWMLLLNITASKESPSATYRPLPPPQTREMLGEVTLQRIKLNNIFCVSFIRHCSRFSLTFDRLIFLLLFFEAADTETSVMYDFYISLVWWDTSNKHASVWVSSLSWAARYVAFLSLRILCISGCNQWYIAC